MITEKFGVFKDFSGRIFSEKMQVIHRLTAFRDKVIHNILWSVGKPGTSFPGDMRVFLHFRVKKCGIVHSVFPGKILSGGECTGKRENCGETGHQREARKGSGDPGNSHSRAASGTPCDFRRSACLHPPLAAAGSGPRLGVWGDRSRARPVGDEARRSVWKRKGALARLFRFPA